MKGLKYMWNPINPIIEAATKSKEQAINHAHKIHDELSWRQKVYNFEIKDAYIVKDLIILNSFITPYEQKKDTRILDNYINSVIVDIISNITNPSISDDSRYSAICNVLTKIDDEKSAEIEATPTLFDFPINNGILKKSLNPEQSAKVRECAHLLLKNDWKIQTFVKPDPEAINFAFIYNLSLIILFIFTALLHINHIFYICDIFKFMGILGILINAFCAIQSFKFNKFKDIIPRFVGGLLGILGNTVLIFQIKFYFAVVLISLSLLLYIYFFITIKTHNKKS